MVEEAEEVEVGEGSEMEGSGSGVKFDRVVREVREEKLMSFVQARTGRRKCMKQRRRRRFKKRQSQNMMVEKRN